MYITFQIKYIDTSIYYLRELKLRKVTDLKMVKTFMNRRCIAEAKDRN